MVRNINSIEDQGILIRTIGNETPLNLNKAKETEKFEGTNYDLNRTSDYNYSKAATAPYNGGDYDYQPEEGRQSPPKTKPPIYDSDSGDDDGNQLISNSNAKYHKERLSQSNLRHSPSRTSPDRR